MIDPRLFLIYQTFKKKYDMVLKNDMLQIKNLNATIHIYKSILGIYNNKDSYYIPEYCIIQLDNLEVIPTNPPLNKEEAIKYVTLAYVIKEVLKPNSIKFIEAL